MLHAQRSFNEGKLNANSAQEEGKIVHRVHAMFATQDMGPAQCVIPIAQEFQKTGLKAIILADGKSLDDWKKTKFAITAEGPDIDAFALLEKHRPQVLVVGFSNRSVIEKKLASAAMRWNENAQDKIAIVGIEDVHGTHRHIPNVKFDLILTLDKIAASVILAKPFFRETKVVVTGSPYLAQFLESEMPPETLEAARKYKFGQKKVVLAVGGDDETHEMLLWLTRSIVATKSDWVIAWRPHPNTFAPEWNPYWDEQMKLIEDLRPGSIQRMPEFTRSGPIIWFADIVIANYSTLLLAAAYRMAKSGSSAPIPVRLRSKKADELLARHAGLEAYPLISTGDTLVGAALEIDWRTPADLDQISAQGGWLRENQKRTLELDPFSATKATREIFALLR